MNEEPYVLSLTRNEINLLLKTLNAQYDSQLKSNEPADYQLTKLNVKVYNLAVIPDHTRKHMADQERRVDNWEPTMKGGNQ